MTPRPHHTEDPTVEDVPPTPPADEGPADEAPPAEPVTSADEEQHREVNADEELGAGGKSALQRERAARKDAEKSHRDMADRLAERERADLRRDVVQRSGLTTYAASDRVERFITATTEHEMQRQATALLTFAAAIADDARRGRPPGAAAAPENIADAVMRLRPARRAGAGSVDPPPYNPNGGHGNDSGTGATPCRDEPEDPLRARPRWHAR